MSIETNLQGRVRNTPLPLTSGLFPLFEAVVNSIHAIEESGLALDNGKIHIRIDRLPGQGKLFDSGDKKKRGPEPQGDITGFTVTDNGIGFNENNYKAFKTLDTDHKAIKGCRGIGRLLWLKAFERVEVKSIFTWRDWPIQLRQRSLRFKCILWDKRGEEAFGCQ